MQCTQESDCHLGLGFRVSLPITHILMGKERQNKNTNTNTNCQSNVRQQFFLKEKRKKICLLIFLLNAFHMKHKGEKKCLSLEI